jgi:hypothetical protein
MSIANFFIPNRQTVSAVTNAQPAVVTTSQDHGYESGLQVRFFFPLDVGMNELNGQIFQITKIDSTNFSIPIDSSNFDSFSPVGTVQTPQVIPVAEVGDSLSQATDNNNNIVPEF